MIRCTRGRRHQAQSFPYPQLPQAGVGGEANSFTMWFLVLLIFFNALADNDLVLRYRFSVGGFPVNVFDILLFVLGPIAVVMSRRRWYPTERVHPVLPWLLALFAAAMAGGLMGSMMSNIAMRATFTTLRNLVTLPVCIWLGYYLLLQPRSAERAAYVHVWVGVATTLFLLLSFGRKAAVLQTADSGGLETLRAVKYVAVYCGMAAVLVLYATVAGVRMFQVWIAVLICGFCFLGQFATLARSDWLALMVAVAVVYFLLPAAQRGGKVAAAVLGPPAALACLWIGLTAASAVTGTDFNKKMYDRLLTMLPGDQPGVQKKAWDTRLASSLVELKWWSQSPIIGRGFGIHENQVLSLAPSQIVGLRHNSYTSTLAETGVIGLSAMLLMLGSTFVVGRRMVRAWTDRGSVLVGALAVVTASIFAMLGIMSMSFNQLRGAIPLGVVCGIVLRARAMQQTALRQQQLAAMGYDQGYYEDPDAYGATHGAVPGGMPASAYPSADPVY